MNKCLGKLHFTTLNYASDYTLHPKLFECTVCTLNYDLCYILHPDISFTVKLDGNMKHVYCLSRTNIKDQKTHLPNQLKTKLFFSSLSHANQLLSPNQNPCNPKSPKQNHLRHHHCSTTTMNSLKLCSRSL